MLSGTEIGLNVWRSEAFERRNFTNQKSFGFLLTDALFSTLCITGRCAACLGGPEAFDLRADGAAA